MIAYKEFLRGRACFYQRSALDVAMRDLRCTAARDPDFGEARAFLAATQYLLSLGGYRTEMEPEEMAGRARESVDCALSLDEKNAIAEAVKGRLLAVATGVAYKEEGLRLLEAAAPRASGDSTPALWLGLTLMRLGDLFAALPALQRAQEQDPLVAINNGYLAVGYTALRQREAGARYALRSVKLTGNTAWLPVMVALRENPGFFRLMDERGAVDYWRAHGFPLDCRLAEEGDLPRLECGEQP